MKAILSVTLLLAALAAANAEDRAIFCPADAAYEDFEPVAGSQLAWPASAPERNQTVLVLP